MKSINLQLPERLRKKLRQWFLKFSDDYTQNELLVWLVDNLPEKTPSKFKSDNEILEYIENPIHRKNMTCDKYQTLKLIGKGIIKPSQDEIKFINEVIKK